VRDKKSLDNVDKLRDKKSLDNVDKYVLEKEIFGGGKLKVLN